MTDGDRSDLQRSAELALADTLISLADEVRTLRAEVTAIEADVDALTVARDRVQHERDQAIALLRRILSSNQVRPAALIDAHRFLEGL